MLDLLLLAILGLLFFRGWLRGLIRESVSLAVIIVGTFLALRLNGAVGAIIEALLGFSENVSRVIAGIFIFLVISIGAAVAIRVLQIGVRLLPGATTLNRVAGGLFSAGAGLIIMTLVLSVVAAVNPSEGIAEQIDGSAIAGFLTDDDGIPQGVLGVLAGDEILATTIRLQDLFGEPNVLATTATVQVPETSDKDVGVATKAADRIFDKANRARVRNDLQPLARAARLDDLALERARDIAVSGLFSLVDADGADAQDRIEESGLRFDVATEIVGLGATPASIFDAMEANDDAVEIVNGDHRRIGLGVVRTVNGLIAVIVFAS